MNFTCMQFKDSAVSGGRGLSTFIYVVEVGLLAHGRQKVQDAGVDADFIVTVVFPGVVLDHVEKLSNKKQDPVFGMILGENQRRINNPRQAAGRGRKVMPATQAPPVGSGREGKAPAMAQQQRKMTKTSPTRIHTLQPAGTSFESLPFRVRGMRKQSVLSAKWPLSRMTILLPCAQQSKVPFLQRQKQVAGLGTDEQRTPRPSGKLPEWSVTVRHRL